MMSDLFNIVGVVHFGIAGNANNSLSIGDVTVPKYVGHTGIWEWLVSFLSNCILSVFHIINCTLISLKWIIVGRLLVGKYSGFYFWKFEANFRSLLSLQKAEDTEEPVSVGRLQVGDYNVPQVKKINRLGKISYQPEEFYGESGKPNVPENLVWAKTSSQWFEVARKFEVKLICLPLLFITFVHSEAQFFS